jgi:hypothetical protein
MPRFAEETPLVDITSRHGRNRTGRFVDCALNSTGGHGKPIRGTGTGTTPKTLKYCPAFAERFASIGAADRFCRAFFTYYNTGHPGIGLHTPATVHDGTAGVIRAKRAEVLTVAYLANIEPCLTSLTRQFSVDQPKIPKFGA